MILQPGLIGDWHKDKATLATVAARAKLGIPPTLYLPTTNLEAKCAAIKEIDRQCGCRFDIHFNFGSKWWMGNNHETGVMKWPAGNDEAWQEEMAALSAALGTIARSLWGPGWTDVANGARFELLLRAILLEDEWRINANDPKALYTNNATPEMLAAIARRWSQRIACLSILGPSHDLICYGRGYNDSWTFNEEAAGNRLDVGRNVYRVAEYLPDRLKQHIDGQVLHLVNSKSQHAASASTAWLTLGLGYDATGKWHDDGPELYPPHVSGQVGRLMRGNVDNVVLYRVASERHLRAFMRGYQGPAASRLKKS